MVATEWARSVGKTVRDHRKTAGLTQRDLADLAGVGKSAVFDIEKGKPTVRLKTLLLVLAALNIELTWRSPLMQDPDPYEETRHA
jgi:y4mF family transcriptional regulator